MTTQEAKEFLSNFGGETLFELGVNIEDEGTKFTVQSAHFDEKQKGELLCDAVNLAISEFMLPQ
jgi:hypothetical protein